MDLFKVFRSISEVKQRLCRLQSNEDQYVYNNY